jgi:hypothetical protein
MKRAHVEQCEQWEAERRIRGEGRRQRKSPLILAVGESYGVRWRTGARPLRRLTAVSPVSLDRDTDERR